MMKKKLSENLLLKIVSVIGAIILWLLVINIDNPTDTFVINNIPITVLNADTALEANGLTYELPEDASVSIEVTTRRQDKRKVSADDFEATIDMNDIYSATGSVEVKVALVNNKGVVRQWTQLTKSIQVTVEAIMEKALTIEVEQSGNPADSVTYRVKKTDPSLVTISAPESIIRQIGSARAFADVDGQSDDISQECQIIYYDVYGNEISDHMRNQLTVSAETTVVELSAEKTNQINVNVEVTGQEEIPEGYKYITYQCDTKSVEVTGAKSIIAGFDVIQITEDISGLTETMTKTYKVSDYLPEGLEPAGEASEEITVVYQVEPLETREFTVAESKLEVKGKSDELDYFYDLSDGMTISLTGLAEDLDKVKTGDIHITLDFSELKENGVYAVIPDVELSGNYASYFEIFSNRVYVTVSEKKEETTGDTDTESSSSETDDASEAETTKASEAEESY